ncbi:ABC transporter substrate-binding protein [Streptomyces sp. NPDC052052]|uniref:ABC transporter substrate-binding protein n=1 Tax=Streptomyces sp. NPDC052052 TaxID=3154756 RepID=UPI0034212D8F
MRTRHPLIAAAAGLAAAAMLTGCTSAGGNDGNASTKPSGSTEHTVDTVRIGTAEENQGPAPAIKGAKQGGTITVYETSDYAHLDPQKIYSSAYQDVYNLVGRQLTGYANIDGQKVLVGDLATDTGKVSDGGKTWTFTLRDGLKWEDGKAITSADVKYGIERSFGKGFEVGLPYFQQWLTGAESFTDAQKQYSGPKDGDLDAIETPDDKTIVLHFPKAQTDVAYAAAWGTTAPVREDKDTGTKYDQKPFSSGPYRITEHKQNSSMTMVRNTHWDPKSDPIRYQNAETYAFKFGQQPVNINQRLLSSSGEDAHAMSTLTGVSTELIDTLNARADKDKISYRQDTGYTYWYVLNNRHITDVNLRKALLYAFPKQQVRQQEGGSYAGDLATTISSPTLAGFQKYDVFKADERGDVAKAKEYLAKSKQKLDKITLAYSNTSPSKQRQAEAIASAYKKIGITVVTKPVDGSNYYSATATEDTPYDMWWTGWATDWPTPSTLIDTVFNSGSPAYANQAGYNSKTTDAELKRIAALTDTDEKSKAYFALEQKIMADAPVIPYVYAISTFIHGKGLVLPNAGTPMSVLNGAYIAD